MKDLDKGAHISPNIQSDALVYEIENEACDPDKKIEAAMEELSSWKNKKVLDVGCGTGFHLPYYAKEAEHVFGVEPHDDSRIKAMRRVSELSLPNVSILKGTAEAVVLEDDTIDLAYSRFAYFWGEGCEPGLNEVFRTLKPGGVFVMIDNNLEQGTFGSWVKKLFNFSSSKQKEIESFWGNQGFEKKVIKSEWKFKSQQDMAKVLKIEFPDFYEELLEQQKGLSIDYVFNLYFKFKA